MSDPVPKRRWLRFGLRTLFVVMTVFGCWMGYSVNWISQRHAFLAQPDMIYEFNDTPPSTVNRWGNTWAVFAPGGLWLLGERGLVSVWLPPKVWSPRQQAEAARLFPEALLLKVNAIGHWVPVTDP